MPSIGALRDELRAVKDGLLRAAGAGTSSSEALSRHEAALQSSVAQFTTHNKSLQDELQAAQERIKELERLSGAKAVAPKQPDAARAAPQHRPPPAAHAAAAKKPPPLSEAERAAQDAAFAKYGSAEYRASAPPPRDPRSRQPP
jgi:hypothetical protein